MTLTEAPSTIDWFWLGIPCKRATRKTKVQLDALTRSHRSGTIAGWDTKSPVPQAKT